MKLIRPNCRAQLTAADFRFIVTTLGRTAPQKRALSDLLTDEQARDQVLDDEGLLQVLLESSSCTEVSEHLYFYVLGRHVLRRVGLEDRQLADYVAELLAQFLRAEHAECRLPGEAEPIRYVVDLLAALERVDDHARFFLQAHLGNQTLFVTGLFPDHLAHRTERRGAPALEYYERMGSASFRGASDHRLAERFEVDGVLAALAEAFCDVRRALNQLSEQYLWLGESTPRIEGPPSVTGKKL